MNGEHKNRAEGFFKSEYRRLVSYVYSLLDEAGDRDAEDVIQDVMVSLFQRLEITGPVEDIAAFIYRSVKNRIIDEYRKKKATVSEDNIFPLKDSRPTPDEIQENDELNRHLTDAIESLPPPMKSVFLLVEIDELTHREAAEELGMPLGTALSLNREAKKRLRHELQLYKR